MMIEFKRKNIITAVNVSFWKVVREYIFWVLGGKPDNHWGETILAFVIKSSNSEVTEKDLIIHCKKLLASFKKPEQIIFVETMPKNSLGKILKTDLKKLYLN